MKYNGNIAEENVNQHQQLFSQKFVELSKKI